MLKKNKQNENSHFKLICVINVTLLSLSKQNKFAHRPNKRLTDVLRSDQVSHISSTASVIFDQSGCGISCVTFSSFTLIVIYKETLILFVC